MLARFVYWLHTCHVSLPCYAIRQLLLFHDASEPRSRLRRHGHFAGFVLARSRLSLIAAMILLLLLHMPSYLYIHILRHYDINMPWAIFFGYEMLRYYIRYDTLAIAIFITDVAAMRHIHIAYTIIITLEIHTDMILLRHYDERLRHAHYYAAIEMLPYIKMPSIITTFTMIYYCHYVFHYHIDTLHLLFSTFRWCWLLLLLIRPLAWYCHYATPAIMESALIRSPRRYGHVAITFHDDTSFSPPCHCRLRRFRFRWLRWVFCHAAAISSLYLFHCRCFLSLLYLLRRSLLSYAALSFRPSFEA